MTIMFQYKGKAYAFCALDEVLIDIENAIKDIEDGTSPSLPMTPSEVTAHLVDRKKKAKHMQGLPGEEDVN